MDRAGSRTTTNSAASRLAEVERGLEEAEGQVGRGCPSHGLAPGGEIAGDVVHSPPRIAEAEEHGPAREDLDLLAGREHQADVAASGGGPGMAEVGARARMFGRQRSMDAVGPACDVDHAEEIAEMIDQEERLDAVAEPVKPLDRRQAGAEPGAPRGVGSIGVGRVVICSQQEGPCGDARFS